MNFKTAIAAAAVLATGVANAAIDTSNTADLFLAVFDTTNAASYVLDLNTTAASLTSSSNLSIGVDSAYSAFLATSGLDASTLRYGVYAVDSQGLKSTKDDVKLFTTATAGQVVAVKNNQQLGIAIANAVNNAGYFNAGSSTVAAYGTSAYATQSIFDGLSGALPGATSSNAVGTASAFYELGVSSGTGTKAADQYLLAGTWKFDGSTVTYTTAAAVPEASTYAMLIAGLAAIGFVARRRAA